MQLALRTWLLVFGVLLILVHHFFPIPYQWQINSLFVVLFLMGIPHGALDFFIDRNTSQARKPIHLLEFLGRYLVNMLAYALVWYFIPVLAVLIFIFLTAYHFGEIDWMGRVTRSRHRLLYLLLGLNWILFLLSVHIGEAAGIFVLMGRSEWDVSFYIHLAEIVLPVSFISLWILHGFLLVYHRDLYATRREFIFSVLQILILALINIALPLWLCFAFYFGIWHSVLSFDLIRREMNLQNDIKGWWALIRRALPYASLAWGGIVLLILFKADMGNLSDVFHFLFIGIAVLTLPHLLVFTKLKVSRMG